MSMKRVPFTIANNSISFYAKGRMYSVSQADPVSYAGLRAALQTPTDQPHDLDTLLGFVDVRQALVNQSKGQIVFIGEDIVFNGQVQHGLWVDKILQFRAAGEPFDPIWNALDRLLHNPTPEAITRLPIFLERAGLGFLPDGRFIAFKGVNADYCSAHVSKDGTRFTHQIGDKPRMARSEVDADPNQTCSTGLHVGAPDYVRGHYSGGKYALVLVAVDPVDVVCVPTDYNGGKMRVCGYEVIDHLDQAYSDELLGRLKTTVTGYSSSPMPTPVPPASSLGDFTDEDDDQIEEEEEEEETNLCGCESGDEDDATPVSTQGMLYTDHIQIGDQLQIGHYVAGWKVTAVDYGTRTYLNGGLWRSMDTIVEVNDELGRVVWAKDAPFTPASPEAVSSVLTTTASEPDPALTAQVGDLVTTAEGGWPPAGTYPVIRVDEGREYRLTLQTAYDGEQGVLNRYVTEVISRPWMRAEIGGRVTLRRSETGDSAYPAPGVYEVVDVGLDWDIPEIQVRTLNGPWWVYAERVTKVEPKA